MYKFHKQICINGLRNSKIIQYNNEMILIGSKEYKTYENIKKYLLYFYKLDKNFDLIINSEKIIDFLFLNDKYYENKYISSWIRDIYFKENEYYLLVELKKNNDNKYFTSEYFLLNSNDFINFNIIKRYNIQDFFYKDFENIFFTAKIENNDNFIWGKYLFSFIKNGIEFKPQFDKIVDYNKDHGHVLHNIDYNIDKKTYTIIFSIRHCIKDYDFFYKIYTAKSQDLFYYYDTVELNIDMNNLNSNWLCYPFKFTYFDQEYIVCNQDDFGKNKYLIILKK